MTGGTESGLKEIHIRRELDMQRREIVIATFGNERVHSITLERAVGRLVLQHAEALGIKIVKAEDIPVT